MTDGQIAKSTWIEACDEDDVQFLKRFLLASGSLKDVAAEYGISYPTVRNRLDRLIAKVKEADRTADWDPFERLVRLMVVDLKLAPATAKQLLAAHKAAKSGRT